jgi:hypothetical protein
MKEYIEINLYIKIPVTTAERRIAHVHKCCAVQ